MTGDANQEPRPERLASLLARDGVTVKSPTNGRPGHTPGGTRVMTDGGRDVGDDGHHVDHAGCEDDAADDEDGQDLDQPGRPDGGALARPDGDGTDDPFEWGPDVEDANGASHDAKKQDADDQQPAGEPHQGDPGSELHGSETEAPARETVGADTGAPATETGAGSHASTPSGASFGEDFDELEARLGRLADRTEDVRVAAINADLKRARDEDDELETTHEELLSCADQLADALERVEGQVAALREAVEEHTRGRASPSQLADRTAPAGRRLPLQTSSHSGRGRRTSSESPDESGGLAFPTDPMEDTDTTETADEPLPGTVDPVEFLIPGANLRDIWRVTARSASAGDGREGPTVERWLLETTPRQPGEPSAREFPAEVTGFTLDPDELSFQEVLDLVDDEHD